MKKFIFTSVLLFVMLLAGKESSAQQTDSTKKVNTDYYSRVLSINQDQAKQVAQIQDNYKTSVKAVLAEPGLSDDARRARIDALIVEKNKKLEALLSPSQLIKVVPTTELDKQKSVEKAQPKRN